MVNCYRSSSFLLSPLALLICTSVGAVSTWAQDVDTSAKTVKKLDIVTIVADRDDPQGTAGSAYVISEQELEKFEHTNIHSILRSVPGVYVREEDGMGTFPRIGIRASSSGRSDRISLMEDGIPAAMAPYANTSAYYFPNVGRMSGVEVLKGPEILRYGPQTTSGAINLISTPIPEERKGFLNAEVGSFSNRKLHSYYGSTEGQWGYLLETYQKEGDGFHELDRSTRDAGNDIEEYMGKLRWSSAPGARFSQQVDIKLVKGDDIANVSYLGVTDADYADNPDRRYGLSELEQMQRGRDSISIQHQFAFTDNLLLTSTAYRNKTYRDYTRLNQINGVGIGDRGVAWIVNNDLAGTNPHNSAGLLEGILHGTADTTHANGVRYGHNFQNFTSTGVQFELLNIFTTGNLEHELTLALRSHKDEANNLGGSNTSYDQRNGSLVFNNYTAGALTSGEAEALSAWISDRISVGNWKLIPLVRFEDIESDANVALAESASNSLTKTTAGLGVNYAISQEWTFLAGVHQGFAPPGSSAVDGTKGEESTNFESGVRYRQGNLGVDAIAFYSDFNNALRNCLVANPCPGGVIDGTQQTGSKDVYGLELGFFAELYSSGSISLPVRLAYTFTDGEYTKDSDTGNVLDGDNLEYTPKYVGSVQFGLESVDGWKVYATASYSDGSCIDSTCDRAEVDTRFLETESLFIVDLTGTYPLAETVDVYAKLDNVLDEQDISHRGADGARGNVGRNAAVGLRVTF